MGEALLPPEVLRNLQSLEQPLQRIEDEVRVVLSNFNRENLETLSSVQRAETFLTLSKTLNALFCLHLRTYGISVDCHPANSELERVVGLYEDKVQKAVDRSTEQRKEILSMGKTDSRKRQREYKTKTLSHRKRPSGLSVAEEAAAFLAEARGELMAQRERTESDAN